MAFIRAHAFPTVDGGQLIIEWAFSLPDWTPPTGRAVENRGFLKDDGGFSGDEARERRGWPVGTFVSAVAAVPAGGYPEDPAEGLEITATLTEIPAVEIPV